LADARKKEEGSRYLIALVGDKRLALPLPDVVEVMRPLPISKLAGAPPSVLGAAVVRGAPVPVVDAGALLGETVARTCTRFVSLRVGGRSAALAVEGLVGVRRVDEAELAAMPPLLRDSFAGVARAIGSLDEELLLVLQAGRIVPEDAWRAIEGEGQP
jgi:purine-binding chemotaxis protein CheW